jgi:hypothetical protein
VYLVHRYSQSDEAIVLGAFPKERELETDTAVSQRTDQVQGLVFRTSDRGRAENV